MAKNLRRFEPIEYAAGTDGSIGISLYDAAGDPLGVSGASAVYKAYEGVPRRRRKPWKGTAVVEKTSAGGQITLATGLATITLTDTDFGNRSGDFWHVLQITDSSGNVSHLGQGELFVRRALV